jgi:hypothetical protein
MTAHSERKEVSISIPGAATEFPRNFNPADTTPRRNRLQLYHGAEKQRSTAREPRSNHQMKATGPATLLQIPKSAVLSMISVMPNSLPRPGAFLGKAVASNLQQGQAN